MSRWVPAYRSSGSVARTLRSLCHEQEGAVERVIVVASGVDQAEHAALAAVVPALPGGRVTLLTSRARLSAGAARNLGAREAGQAGWLLFVDADCRPARGCVQLLLAAARREGLAAAAAAVVRDGGGAVAWTRHALEFKHHDSVGTSPWPWLCASATMLCRRADFELAGGFPDMWPGEDLVLCTRLRDRGGRVRRVSEALTWHLHPAGFGEMLRHQVALGRTSALARTEHGVQGNALSGRVWLAPLLFCGRAVRTLAWYARYRPVELWRVFVFAPLLGAGLAAWCKGFASGLRISKR